MCVHEHECTCHRCAGVLMQLQCINEAIASHTTGGHTNICAPVPKWTSIKKNLGNFNRTSISAKAFCTTCTTTQINYNHSPASLCTTTEVNVHVQQLVLQHKQKHNNEQQFIVFVGRMRLYRCLSARNQVRTLLLHWIVTSSSQ